MVSERARLAHLDGLRGIAAVAVVFFHFFYVFQPAAIFGVAPGKLGAAVGWLHASPLYAFISGGFAVSLFFVLSGFVLSLPFCLHRERRVAVEGLLRRYPRLAAPILSSNLLYGLLLSTGLLNREALLQVWALTGAEGLDVQYGLAPVVWTDMIRHALWDVFQASSYQYNPVLWTMHIELVGSFLILGLLLLCGKSRHRGWIYGLLAVVGVVRYPIYLAFLTGLVLCELYVGGHLNRLKSVASHLVLLGLALYLAGIPTHPFSFYTETPAYQWVSGLSWLPIENRRWLVLVLAATAVIAVSLQNLRIQQPLGGRVGRFLGKISFGLYLTHMAVLFTVTAPLFLWLQNWVTPTVAAFAGFLASLPVMIALAWLMSRLVDEPAIRFSRQFSKTLCNMLYGAKTGVVAKTAFPAHHAPFSPAFALRRRLVAPELTTAVKATRPGSVKAKPAFEKEASQAGLLSS